MCALLLAAVGAAAVTAVNKGNYTIYYPDFSRIDLVCGQMPKATDKTVEYCCEAAFTGELLNEFKHSNIADNHISGGKMLKGYSCRANTGAFVWGKGKWRFMPKGDFPTSANGWQMGFCQLLIIKDGTTLPLSQKLKNQRNIYRALCELDGKLCLIECKKAVRYEDFVKALAAMQVTHALYLDMGSGWNYAWYRNKQGKVIARFPESKLSPNYKFRTNWLTFYK